MTDSLFTLSLSWGTLVAFLAGISCVLLSCLLIIFRKNRTARFVFRDIITLVGLGALLPIWWIKVNDLSFNKFGLLGENWAWAMLANIILASLLAAMFYFEAKKKGQKPNFSGKYGTIFYLMVGVLFETLFFYSFLRQLFEETFGIIPALLLTSAFYSLHHIGLEEQMKDTTPAKELTNLFFVGLIYSITFRIFNSALAIFPFFIGVGVISDLIVQKQSSTLPWKIALLTLFLMIASAGIIIYL
jgi:membrane protease YdiL (CAAX protease family)